MVCTKCGGKSITEETVAYQMECRNHLFCFEDVPVPKCPDCGHFTITEEIMKVMLVKVEQISQKATISYHRCRWPKAQQLEEQQPSSAVAEEIETLNKSARK